MEQNNSTQAALDAGLAIANGPDLGIDAKPYHVLPANAKLQDLESLLPQPVRRRGHFATHCPAGFAAYYNRHKSENSLLCSDADLGDEQVYGALNYHEAGPKGAAHWGDHTCRFTPRPTPDWQAWVVNHGVWKTQADFAMLIENQLHNIVDPPGADLLEMTQTLTAHQSATYVSQLPKSGSTVVRYEEATRTAAGAQGDLVLPNLLKLRMQIYLHGELVTLAARVRVTAKDKQILLHYELVQPDDVRRAAFASLVEEIERLTEAPVISGWLD